MIGIILTGHGSFASGLNSALELIAGKQKEFEVVDFKREDSVAVLEANLSAALDRLRNCDEIAFLTDLAGGSPFKNSATLSLSQKKGKSFVIAGTNLGMLLGISMSRDTYNIEGLKQLAVELGTSSVKIYETTVRKNEDNEAEVSVATETSAEGI